MDLGLKGLRAVVTGASKGIGRRAADIFAQEGASVAICARNADEVAAAAIRYPLGIAGALRRCEAQHVDATTFFTTDTYAQWRWVWFNLWSDRSSRALSDLDDVELRARALEEW